MKRLLLINNCFNMKKLIFFTFLIIIFIEKLCAQNVSIDFNNKRQIIRGFGGIHIKAWTGRELTPDMMEKAFDNDPGEIGLTIFRTQISDNTANWADELPIAKYAISKGAIVFSSPWNPPSYMRVVKGTYNNETDYVLLEQYYPDYVNHLNNYISYMNNNGVSLYAISIQNEPDWHGWTTWTAKQMLKFLKENAQNINCKVIAPESFNYNKIFIDSLINDNLANSRIDILGTHIYGTPKSGYYYNNAYQKNKEIWMTEHLLGSESPSVNTWSLALDFAEEINYCMDARMSAYVYWYIRRFYGLIDDAGNITDKGYVISHFSKFVRPGSFNVQVSSFTPLTNVTVTAYVNDSTVNIIIVNKNNSNINLTFNLQNIPNNIDSLVKFTTNQIKKVTNDGVYKIINGQLNVNIEPLSIVTLTSDPRKGGKCNNLKPVAVAGKDTTIVDIQGQGINFLLDASKSYDSDGNIVKYSWAKDGLQIASTASYNVNLSYGTHTFILTVTDNDGAVNSDTLIVIVKSPFNTEIWLEAECTNIGSKWQLLNDTKASEGKYLTVNPAYESLGAPSSDPSDYLIYNFSIEEEGDYKIWGRVITPTPNDDSYWIKVDDGNWIMWNNIPATSTWAWDDVHNQSNDNPVTFYLTKGNHTLYVCFRENGANIDKFYITNTGKIPSNIGGEAQNCSTTFIYEISNNSRFNISPNPFISGLNINGCIRITSIEIYNIYGKLVFKQDFDGQTSVVNVDLNLISGIYIVKINHEKGYEIVKIIKQ